MVKSTKYHPPPEPPPPMLPQKAGMHKSYKYKFETLPHLESLLKPPITPKVGSSLQKMIHLPPLETRDIKAVCLRILYPHLIERLYIAVCHIIKKQRAASALCALFLSFFLFRNKYSSLAKKIMFHRTVHMVVVAISPSLHLYIGCVLGWGAQNQKDEWSAGPIILCQSTHLY